MEAARHFQGSWLCVGDWPAPGKRAALLRVSAAPSPLGGVSLSAIAASSRSAKVFRVNCTAAAAAGEQLEEEVLPDKLREIVSLFAAVRDQRAAYEQLMHYAKRLPPLPDEHRTDANKVVGCVSRVWVRAYLGDHGKVFYEADSDSILTKGLAALLVEGLSGSRPREIVRLTPAFFHMLGLKQSLTPARTSGFYNMFRLMQKKALEMEMDSSAGSSPATAAVLASPKESDDARSAATPAAPAASAATRSPSTIAESSPPATSRSVAIEKKLQEALAPTVLEVEDVSHQHAGHAAVRGTTGGETHFNVKVVAAEFEGQSVVKRHRRVYQLLEDELKSGLHALSIVAKAPSELG
ncbi:hypothetical protein SELMODRAFT_439428 [Selaginella moellendorffii]|uniref:Fe-S metabolism associated domain-containing protein n=1 Tax=Selaginella moellendorffii TaxID=88036 RepID=D8R4C8_SELML|nr:sufE-like protein 1, chloroplastic/mitochondrial [Selaginella moellendorffii]EFJ33442.1 hypothetical protein SELMODRAFT_439428 [Selaginella moellendorffii]|eukprot:XP_002966022.1 sufE-like protein 1, chloroplastic/mitochondrial [Selaginella moellendorffii]